MNFKKIIDDVQSWVEKRSPEILIGIGITGFLTTTVLAVRATPKALRLKGEAEEKKGDKLTPFEVVKETGVCYIPAVISGGLSIAAIIGSNYIQGRRTAALATAYSISQDALRTYQEKVIETIGEKKEERIRDEIVADKVNAHKIADYEVVFVGGDTLCYDEHSDRFFKGDIAKIKDIPAQLNEELYQSMFVSINEYYYILGLKPLKNEEDLGWDVNRGRIKLNFSSCNAPDGTPAFCIKDFAEDIGPRFDYHTA